MVNDNIIEEFVQAIQPEPQKIENTHSAVVSRVDDEGVVWVRLSGSSKETPTASSSAEVGQNDYVNVEWRNNKLYIVGNYSNPAAGAIRVDAVEQAANVAKNAAQSAAQDAARARETADGVEAIAKEAQETADGVEAIAKGAQESADNAQASASDAKKSANSAFDQLAVVENIVGILNMLTEQGEYSSGPTNDTEVSPGKWYFIRSGTAPDYRYDVVQDPTHEDYILTEDTSIVEGKTYYTYDSVEEEYVEVTEPDVSEISTYYEYTASPHLHGFYELVGINDAIRNYVSSHLVLSSDGLWLQSDNTKCKVQLSSEGGLVLYGTAGPLAEYGETAIIGDKRNFHIEIDNSEIGFYQGEGAQNKVAFMSGAELYVTNSLSFGHFIFLERENGHFTLKKID